MPPAPRISGVKSVSSEPPANPFPSEQWLDTTSGVEFTWLDTAACWIEINPIDSGPTGGPPAEISPPPDPEIDQHYELGSRVWVWNGRGWKAAGGAVLQAGISAAAEEASAATGAAAAVAQRADALEGRADSLETRADNLESGMGGAAGAIAALQEGLAAALERISTLETSMGLVLLASGEITNLANLVLSFADYDAYRSIKIMLTDWIVGADSTEVWMQMSKDGVAFDGGASDYETSQIHMIYSGAPAIGVQATQTTHVRVSEVTSPTLYGFESEIDIFNQADTGKYPRCRVRTTNWRAGQGTMIVLTDHFRLAAQKTKAVKFYGSTGVNIASGKYAVYGFA